MCINKCCIKCCKSGKIDSKKKSQLPVCYNPFNHSISSIGKYIRTFVSCRYYLKLYANFQLNLKKSLIKYLKSVHNRTINPQLRAGTHCRRKIHNFSLLLASCKLSCKTFQANLCTDYLFNLRNNIYSIFINIDLLLAKIKPCP